MKLLISIKSVVILVCIVLFLFLMKDVWNKFKTKLTSTGVQFRTENIVKKRLPLLTICPWPRFKKQGFFLIYEILADVPGVARDF